MKRQLITILVALLAGLAVGRYLLGRDPPRGRTPTMEEMEVELGFGVSHILFDVSGDGGPPEAFKRAKQTYRALLDGADFAELARSRSQDPTAPDGGFLGFVRPQMNSIFSGVMQTLRPGQISPVIMTPMGYQIIKRHSFEEARRLEKRYWIPVHGFRVPWKGMPGGAGRTRAQALSIAEETKAKLAAGELTLDEAAAMHRGEQPPRPQGYLGLYADRPQSRALFNALKDKEPGVIVGPVQTEEGWAVVVRGRPLRSLVRHIMVQHALSEGRQANVVRTPSEARERAEQALAELAPDLSNWDQLVEKYSDDLQSLRNRGTIGVLTNGDVMPGFETVIYDLEPGKVADKVVETPLGFHVIWKVN